MNAAVPWSSMLTHVPRLDAPKGRAVPTANDLVGGDRDDAVAFFVDHAVPHVGGVPLPSRQDAHRVGVPEHHHAAHAHGHEEAMSLKRKENKTNFFRRGTYEHDIFVSEVSAVR